MNSLSNQHETIRSVYAIRTLWDGILDEAIFLTREGAEEYGRRRGELDPFVSDTEVIEMVVQGS